MKSKTRKYVCDVDHMGQNTEKKITANYNSFEKMNPIKGLQSPCQKCMDQFFYPYFDILMTSASRMSGHRKVYQNFIFNFEDIWKRKFVFYQALIAFFHTGNLFHPECWQRL